MHLDTKARKPMFHKGKCAAVQCLVGNDLVTRFKKRPQQRRDGADPGRDRNRRLTTFQTREPLFKY